MNFLTQLNVRMSKFAAERRAISELRAMSDRDLHDIGLSRSEIPGAVRGGISVR